MTKEEFLAISLPYELKGTVKGKSNVSGEFIYTLHNCPYKAVTVEIVGSSDFYTDVCNFKPILHPLSDLTKPITHKGETFVPCEQFSAPVECDLRKGIVDSELPFCVIRSLIKWHFDIFGLIEKGEAIDINTLDKNPYE